MKKSKKVYDSFSDDEFFIIDNNFRVDPFSKTKYIIDFMIFLVVIYSIFFTPIRIIFSYNKSQSMFILEMLCDFLMVVDFFSGFITGFYDFEENYIVKRKDMIKNYLRTTFFIDFISGIPFNSLIEFYINYINNIPQNYENDLEKYLSRENKENGGILNPSNLFLDYNHEKKFMLLKILRLFKFIKITSKNAFIDQIRNQLNFISTISSAVNRIFFSFLYFLIISHILSCIYIFLGSLAIPSWINNINIQNKEFSDIYLASMYFNHATIFTIGYGDVLSKNIYERIYNVLLMFIGVMIYSFAVTSLSNIIQQSDENTKIYLKKMEYLQELKVKYNIKKNLHEKIARYLKYDKNSNKKDKNDLLKELPTSLRNDMILFMYDDIIKSFLFFKNFMNIEFIIKAIICFKPVRSLKKEVLVKETDFIEEMIFIKKGVLSLECAIIVEKGYNINGITKISSLGKNLIKTEKYQNLKIIEIRRYEHFGDVLIFLNERSPLTVRTKSKYSELFLMKKMDLIQLTMDFPDIFEQIYIKSSFNMDQIKKSINKTKNFYFNKLKSTKNFNTRYYSLKILNKENEVFEEKNNNLNLSKENSTNNLNDLNNDISKDNNSMGFSNKKILKNSNNRNNETKIELNIKKQIKNIEQVQDIKKIIKMKSEKSNSSKDRKSMKVNSKINKKIVNKSQLSIFKEEQILKNSINNVKKIEGDKKNLNSKSKLTLTNLQKNSKIDSFKISSTLSSVNSESIKPEEKEIEENKIFTLIPDLIHNNKNLENKNVQNTIKNDISNRDRQNLIHDSYEKNQNFQIIENLNTMEKGKNSENLQDINKQEKKIYSIKEDMLVNQLKTPIYCNFNFNNNYNINKNQQQITINDIKEKENIYENSNNNIKLESLCNNFHIDINNLPNKQILEVTEPNDTLRSDNEKTLSYLNLTNIFPIDDNKIIQNVNHFTINNKYDNFNSFNFTPTINSQNIPSNRCNEPIYKNDLIDFDQIEDKKVNTGKIIKLTNNKNNSYLNLNLYKIKI